MIKKTGVIPAALWLASMGGGIALMAHGQFWVGGFLVLCAFSAFVP